MPEKPIRKKRNLFLSFIGGVTFTILLVVVVPVLCTDIIAPLVAEKVGNTSIIWFSSSMISTAIMWGIIGAFMLILGGGGTMRFFGVVGVLGLICGYYLLGKPQDAIIPVGTLIIFIILSYTRKKNKEKQSQESD